MLPDFPELKAELSKLTDAKLRRRIHSKDPVISTLRCLTQHEGKRQRYAQRPDGNVVEEGFEAVSGEVFIQTADVPTLVGPALEQKLEELANKVVSDMARGFFKKIGETCDRAGMSVDAKGQPMSPELLLEMMDRVEMEFDSSGNPTTTFVLHPDLMPTLKVVFERIDNDPELKRRHDGILRRQREAWAARENNRKLAN